MERIIKLYECSEDACRYHADGLTLQQVILLCGIFCLHPDFDFHRYKKNFKDNEVQYNIQRKTVEIILRTEKLVLLHVTIHLAENERYIELNYIEKYNPNVKNGYVRAICDNIELHAGPLGFDEIILTATNHAGRNGGVVMATAGFCPVDEDLLEHINSCRKTCQLPTVDELNPLTNPFLEMTSSAHPAKEPFQKEWFNKCNELNANGLMWGGWDGVRKIKK